MKVVFNDRVDVKFGRLVKKTELRVTGMDDAIVLEEVTRTSPSLETARKRGDVSEISHIYLKYLGLVPRKEDSSGEAHHYRVVIRTCGSSPPSATQMLQMPASQTSH